MQSTTQTSLTLLLSKNIGRPSCEYSLNSSPRLIAVQSLVPEQHGDAPSHDVELPALMLDERERVLGCIRHTAGVQRVEAHAGFPLPCSTLP